MTERTATCSCGQLRVHCSGAPVRVSVCHCLECQKRTGSTYGVQARWPRTQVRIEGVSTAYARVADSGNGLTFHFCPHCGSTVHYQLDNQSDLVAVAVGAFADPLFPAPKFSVYEQRKHAWVGIDTDVERLG
ncbi:MAG TPA: GFA family protein [Rhizomicrobium sp.]|jgi:hypothetical protein|nr:GFA family protein [Rhizomicrobium sp.]